jgi:hypothetical protein
MVCQTSTESASATQDSAVLIAVKSNAHWVCRTNFLSLKKNAVVIFMEIVIRKLAYVLANLVLGDLHASSAVRLAHLLTVGNSLTRRAWVRQLKGHYGTILDRHLV